MFFEAHVPFIKRKELTAVLGQNTAKSGRKYKNVTYALKTFTTGIKKAYSMHHVLTHTRSELIKFRHITHVVQKMMFCFKLDAIVGVWPSIQRIPPPIWALFCFNK